MNLLKKKGSYYILLLIATVLALVTVILGATQKAMTTNYNFSLPLIIVMVVGIIVVVANLFVDFDFMPLLAAALYSVGFGMIIDQGIPVIVDKINGIAFQGGNFNSVIAYVGMMLVACILCFVACFIKKDPAK